MPDSQAPVKHCRWCTVTKSLDDFYAHPQMRDGYLNKCRECVKAYTRGRHHEKMADPVWREGERARGRKKYRDSGWMWRKVDPVRKAARTAVASAVSRGDMVPPEHCGDCGHDFSEFRREGHHADYSRPLEVVWLCALCHGKRHRSVA